MNEFSDNFHTEIKLRTVFISLALLPGGACTLDGASDYEAEGTAGLQQSADIPALPQAVTNNAVVSVTTTNGEYLVSFAGLGKGRTHSDTLAVGELAYVFGGYSVAEDGTEISTPWVHSFDPVSGQFEERAEMPVPVDDAVAVTFEDRYIYLISGWHDLGNVNLVQRYDTIENSWSQATPIPGPAVFGHAGGIVSNTIVYCDGVAIEVHENQGRDFVAVSDCYQGIIDASDSRRIDWRVVEAHPGLPRYRMAATGAEEFGGVLFIGGSENPYN